MKALNIIAVLTLIFLASCSKKTDITDRIHEDFETRRAQVARPDLYAVFDSSMTREQREAMEFLYAYMPFPDMTDHTGQFYLDNVKASMKAREEMPWGNIVPEREFRHFVLPVRVNNENLDSSRMVFYRELKDRVKGLTMTDAILEINHWCHEKVTYRPSDSRTSSPLATMSTAFGRCGEESTFAVAALRAMGIPARQVYTPRWAHTDDNHAWVEAWTDGQWHFLGACEPEPILDMGWFNAPASRGMMMNTRVMGPYDGPEEQLGKNNCYTEINVTANYAPVATATVHVSDTDGKPVEGARVEFKLYNYGEFYTIAKKTSDTDGIATLTSGLGDMLVWASFNGRYGFSPVTVSSTGGEVSVVLDKDDTTVGIWEWDMVPPAQSATLPQPDAMQIEINETRKATEDSIRTAYTGTFVTDKGDILAKSAGNHAVISAFLSRHADNNSAMAMLKALADKDLADITTDVLEDHIATPSLDTELYNDYVLNPRVINEMLTPYKAFLHAALGDSLAAICKSNPHHWVAWCADSITIDNQWNPQWLRMSPRQVYTGRVTDSGSRDIFFVAGARSMGIPARIDVVTGKPQYADPEGHWQDADFNDVKSAENAPQGTLALKYKTAGRLTDPQYYYHFTLSRIGDDGSPVLLNYPDDSPLSKTFTPSTTVDAGQYALVTGQRMANGTVLTRLAIFNVEADHITEEPMIMRQNADDVQVIGSFNSENPYHDMDTGCDKSLLSTTGRGYYIIALITPNHEPTTHALNDISQYREQFEQWGGKIMLLFPDGKSATRFDASRFPDLPSTVVFGTDINGTIQNEITSNMKLDSGERPVFLIADTFNRVVYLSQGYSIGQGERLIDTLHKLK